MHRLLPLVLLAGCATATFAYTPASAQASSPKPDNCVVDVLGSPPSRSYDEVGTLEYYNGSEPTSLAEFRKAVATQVCQAGGDAVIAIPDEKGKLTKGSVIRYAAR